MACNCIAADGCVGCNDPGDRYRSCRSGKLAQLGRREIRRDLQNNWNRSAVTPFVLARLGNHSRQERNELLLILERSETGGVGRGYVDGDIVRDWKDRAQAKQIVIIGALER